MDSFRPQFDGSEVFVWVECRVGMQIVAEAGYHVVQTVPTLPLRRRDQRVGQYPTLHVRV